MESTIRKLFIVLALLSTLRVAAQTPKAKEWLAKKKTQRQYFANQVVALQAYLEVLKKGYDIAGKGMGIIGSVSGDEGYGHYYRLQNLYNTNPELNPNSILTDAGILQQRIESEFSELLKFCLSNPVFSDEEIGYVRKVASNLKSECAASVSELGKLFDGYSIVMKDDEKIERITAIKAELVEQYSFTGAFCNSTRTLGIARAKEKHEITTFHDQL